MYSEHSEHSVYVTFCVSSALLTIPIYFVMIIGRHYVINNHAVERIVTLKIEMKKKMNRYLSRYKTIKFTE